MPIWIAEINAAPATVPIISPFYDNSVRSETGLPAVEFVLADGERHMQRTITAMAGNGAAGAG